MARAWACRAPAGLEAVHLFGSGTWAAAPRDLDLLVVYRREVVSPADAGTLRGEIQAAIAGVPGLPRVEILLLTGEEATQSRFAERESAVELYRRGRE